MLMTRNRFMTDVFDLVRRDVETLMGGARPNGFAETSAAPAVNLWETPEALVAELELPGVTHEQLDIQVLGDELTIRGSRTEAQPEGAVLHRRERRTGEFARKLQLPFPVNGDQVQATLRDGILQIHLPKAREAMPRKIEVKPA